MDCWHDEIENAATEAEIIRNASEYLRLWAPRDLDPAELGLYDMRVRSYVDLESVNIHLADAPRTGSGAAHLREIAEYFWHASEKIANLRAASTPPLPAAAARRAPSPALHPRP